MVFSNIVPSHHLGALSLQQALELTNVYLENAYKSKDPDVAMVLCHGAEAALSQAKRANRKYPAHPNDAGYHVLREGIATAYIDLGKYLDRRGYQNEAVALCKKAEKWGIAPSSDDVSTPTGDSKDAGSDQVSRQSRIKPRPRVATIPARIFPENVRPPTVELQLPEADERLTNTVQLVCCLGLLKASHSPDDILEPAAHKWLQVIERDTEEQERLHALSTEVIRAFKRDELKDAKAIAEVVCLSPVLNKDSFHDLLREFYSGIHQSGLLNFQLLEGLAQLIQGADPSHLNSDDLVKILDLLSTRLRDTHQHSAHHMHQLTLAVSHVLDAMADTKVTDLDREKLHAPLSTYLGGLMKSQDPFLVYQAAYAYQALLCIPDNETVWQAAMRRSGKVIQGVAGLVSAVKGLDLDKFLDGLTNIQQGMDGVSKVMEVVMGTYDDVTSLAKSGQGFVKCLKEGLSFERQRDWYSALRGADALVRDGELATFKKLVCGAPCRYDAAFQWGVCQRLGEMAANPAWDAVTRRSAIAFLGEIYRDDDTWGQQASVKQWILNILMQLAATGNFGSSSSGGVLQLHAIAAGALLQELEVCEDANKKELYRQSRANGPIAYPLKITLPELGSPSLLDRVQNRPDVEGNIRVLRKQRTKERGNTVYIPPQANSNLQASDDARFPLMEKVRTFLDGEQKVFLLLGDSGAGKSTFNRELEFELWQKYDNKTGRIPLHINLPAIEKPEHDMIAKQLRRAEFTEPQIREMKHHRRFILICDGYDESQQTHNLYVTNKLNEPGEWDAHMVISCRSEYLGVDYRDRFQPGGDRNVRSDSLLFQEAVIAPFTLDQVQAYIQQYVAIHQPLWRIEDYNQALELIPSLKDLVKNPFLMTLSLDVLPRMVDPGQHLSTALVTRVALYDHFVEQWLERGKKRLGEKDMLPQTKAAFERLSAGGFTLSGIEYLKRLSVAIYKEQGGNPVLEYSPLIDEGSWKEDFFKEKHKQLLLEASPMTRNANQYRFIHRSLLEYGLARAVFDPRDRKNRAAAEPVHGRRGSTSSTLSFEMEDTNRESTAKEKEPDPNSPLVWRSFVNDHSLLQFLEERVQHEPVLKQQLLAYIEHSKLDKKWRKAAANAITILVRSGVQFNDADLRGIQIPGADISYGLFDSAQLQEADLRKVNLRGVWMRHADLSGAQMEGVQFGELPHLSEESEIRSCAYSPDGKLFAVGLRNGEIAIYFTSHWEKAMTFIGHEEKVRCVAFSPNGDQLISACSDCTARLWDVEEGTCRYIFIHSLQVSCVAYSPGGTQIAISCHDHMLRLRDSRTGECLRTFSGHDGGVLYVAFSPQGNKIATCSQDLTIRMWDVETGCCNHIMFGHNDPIWGLAFSPRGDQLASASDDMHVRLWDAETGLCRHVLAGHTKMIVSVAFSPKGDQVVSAGHDRTIQLWDAETGMNRHTFSGHSGAVMDVALSPQGNQMATVSWDMTVRLWDVSAQTSRYVSNGPYYGLHQVKSSTDGDQVAIYNSGNTIELWDMRTGICKMILKGHTDVVRDVAFSPQGDEMVSISSDTLGLLWNVEAGNSRLLIENGFYFRPSIAFSPQGDIVAFSCSDATTWLLDVTTGEHVKSLNFAAFRIVFSPDGKLIAALGWESDIEIWDIESSSRRHRMVYSTASLLDLVFSPQGHQVACVTGDERICLWDVETGSCQMILIGHSFEVKIVFSIDGDTLVSGASDGIVRLWDVSSGQCRAAVQGGQISTVLGITRHPASGEINLFTSASNGSMLVQTVIDERDQCRLSLKWIATRGELMVREASVQGARRLSQLNKDLLRQRGAQGEPEYRLREASKKVLAMASVVSRIQKPTSSLPDNRLNVL
ncbi:hypothetical protein BGX31_006763 [Mortierella sp. GBA43]|nr:hypothetical protein BGX31_006763 [Mortierella sp. GBA43]